MGFAGVMIPEDHGGVDMGHMAAGLIAMEMGKNLTASPFLSSAVLAATAIKQGGSDAQKAQWLPQIATGETIIALAVDEGVKHNPSRIEMSAVRSGNGFKLNGEKSMVSVQKLRAFQLSVQLWWIAVTPRVLNLMMWR